MNAEKQQIAIAEACGYVRGKETEVPYRDIWTHEGQTFCDCDLPDYLNDLNAMREAWNTLNPVQQHTAINHLERMLNGPCDTKLRVVNATASQRAEAFLRTIGKWEDGE